MNVYEVRLNGKKLCTAGVKDGVTTVLVNKVASIGGDPDHLDVRVGGLDTEAEEYVTWAVRDLMLGDEISVRLVQGKRVSQLIERRKSDRVTVDSHRRKYVEKTAQELGWKIVKPKARKKKSPSARTVS